jgi:hypothetical protein
MFSLQLMKTSIYLLILALLLTIAFAQAPPPAKLKDPFLDNFVGDWKVERKMGNGRIVESTVRGEWALKHHFIKLHYGAGEKSLDYEALVFISFVAADKTYVCHWLDVYGAGYDAPGRGKLDDKLLAIELRWESRDGALTNKFTFDSQAKTWTSLIRQVEKGEWKTFAEEKWTKK